MEKKKPGDKNCIFCKIAKGEIPAKRIFENDNFIVIPDARPRAEGHCLIISKKHYATILDLPASLGTELVSIAKEQGLRLIGEGKAQGFNVGQNNLASAGQIIPHFHVHIIPRKKGDKIKWD